jgi:hypothetical protein
LVGDVEAGPYVEIGEAQLVEPAVGAEEPLRELVEGPAGFRSSVR